MGLTNGRAAFAGVPARIVALDWALAETLVALGHAPLAVAEAPLYAQRVIEPALPPDTLDVGLRNWPNLEAVRALRPNLIVTLEGYGVPLARLEAIAPVRALPLYTTARHPLHLARRATTELASVLGREVQGARLLSDLDRAVTPAGADERPMLILKFADERIIDIYGQGSLFDDVLRAKGLRNSWTGVTNIWGFATTGIEELARHPEARLLIIEPAPIDLMQRGAIWRALPQVRAGRTRLLPPVWVFGGLPSAIRFTRLLGTT
ncbi:ABC transporter substrate-binding protein [Xinfangfangia sp. D13-10-4-6]|uniref:ABC transporter substrate-binding protein n=1 Tax=Pseudogemmobacter hezensis TaxID=2737662 RepID=UPI001555AF85|nr:ABC transporter substrate-binding protein [Pseudogemmobacter hezensis]